MTDSNEPSTNWEWYDASGKRKVGPFSFAQLQELARAGQIQPASMVWQKGTQNWGVREEP